MHSILQLKANVKKLESDLADRYQKIAKLQALRFEAVALEGVRVKPLLKTV